MRAALVLVVLAVLAGTLAAPAHAAPVAGGVYDGPLRTTPFCMDCWVHLAVARSGRVLAEGSAGAPCENGAPGAAARAGAPRRTPIARDGSFGWRASGLVVKGRFSSDGSRAIGTVRFEPGRGCDTAGWSFQIPRHRTVPAPPRPACRTVSTPRYEVELVRRGVSCRLGARLLRRWSESALCLSPAGLPRPCHVAGFACAPVAAGLLHRLASAGCRRGAARAELVVRRQCTPLFRGQNAIDVIAVTATCATAERVTRAWWRRAGCRNARCRVEAWTCRFVRARRSTLCAQSGRRAQAVEIRVSLIIESDG